MGKMESAMSGGDGESCEWGSWRVLQVGEMESAVSGGDGECCEWGRWRVL